MNLRQIRYFIAAAEAESVSRAAQELGISQSAITAAIQALEYETGASLFVRHAKGVRLTHEGHQLALHARRIMAAVADARRAVSARPEAMSGDLNLGVTHMVSGYYLADLLARFRRGFPRVDVRVVEDERTYLEHLLVNGELDVGLLLVSNLQDRQALESEVLVRSPWRIWLPEGHALAAGNVLALADLAAEPLITLAVDELTETTTAFWQRQGLTPNGLGRGGAQSGRHGGGACGPAGHGLPALVARSRPAGGEGIVRSHPDCRCRSCLAAGRAAAADRQPVSRHVPGVQPAPCAPPPHGQLGISSYLYFRTLTVDFPIFNLHGAVLAFLNNMTVSVQGLAPIRQATDVARFFL